METTAAVSDDIQAAARRLAAAGLSPDAIWAAHSLSSEPSAIVAWVRLLVYARPSDLCWLLCKSQSVISRKLAPLLIDEKLARHRVKDGAVGRPTDVFTLPASPPPSAERLATLDRLVQDIVLVRPVLSRFRPHNTLRWSGEIAATADSEQHHGSAAGTQALRSPEQPVRLLYTTSEREQPAHIAARTPGAAQPPQSAVVPGSKAMPAAAPPPPPWHSTAALTATASVAKPATVTGRAIVEAPLPIASERPTPHTSPPVPPTVRLAPPQPRQHRPLLHVLSQAWVALDDLWWAIGERNADFHGWLWPLIVLALVAGGLAIAWPLGLDQAAAQIVADLSAPYTAPTQAPAPTLTIAAPVRARVAGTGGAGLVVRETAGGKRVAKLAEHTQVEVIAGPVVNKDRPQTQWWRVRSGAVEGWVSGDFLLFMPGGD
jgi:hypothetical protein